MKKTIVIIMALTMSSLGTQAWAQATKVGVVNMGAIYSGYEKVKTFKSEMEVAAKPFKDKKDECEKCIKLWTDALNDPKRPLSDDDRTVKGPKIIIEARRQLEDLDRDFKKVIGKKLEDQMVQLNREINDRIREYAGPHGYHLILAYGEPDVPLKPLDDFRRKMTVIDGGGLTIAYIGAGVDISREIVQVLNSSYRPSGLPVNK